MTLEGVRCGQKAKISQITGERSFCRRLMELGLVPGTEIELMRISALGELVQLRARGALFSIRRAEARGVTVELSKVGEPSTSQTTNAVSVA